MVTNNSKYATGRQGIDRESYFSTIVIIKQQQQNENE
jgi:hypothetical protein